MQRNVIAATGRWFAWWFALAIMTFIAAPALADAKVEKAAKALQKKAIEEDNLNLNYAGAIKKLQSAITKCGPSKCGVPLKAALVRDLGAMQVLNGSTDEGKSSFAQALGLDSTIDLDPAYKNPTIQGVWDGVKKKGGGGAASTASAPAGPPPSGDFVHEPPAEALVRTPLPIYVEYPGTEDLAKVVAKFKASGMTEWKSVELQKLDTGFGALVPCKSTPQGSFQYYIQGFNDRDDPVATSGSRNKPFSVPVKAQIDGTPPGLPGQEPPVQCPDVAGTGSECPPDFPGCGGEAKKEGGEDCEKNNECKSESCSDGKCVDKKAGGDECKSDGECNSGSCTGGKCSGKKGEGEDCESDEECDSDRCKVGKCAGAAGSTKAPKVWLGLGVQLDIYSLPSAADVCRLNASGKGPLNSAGYGCVDLTGKNFPGSNQTFNSNIVPSSATTPPSDQVSGGFKLGNARIMLSIDVALGGNVLLGGRLGYVLGTDPATGTPGAAFPLPIHLEARVTYVVGRGAIAKKGLSPMLFLGLGAGEFDAYVPVKVFSATDSPGASPHPFNAWLTAGPVFVAAGGGARFLISHKVAMTGALKLEGAFGGSAGFLPGIAPEIGLQLGL